MGKGPCYCGNGIYLHAWRRVKVTERYSHYRCSSCGAAKRRRRILAKKVGR